MTLRTNDERNKCRLQDSSIEHKITYSQFFSVWFKIQKLEISGFFFFQLFFYTESDDLFWVQQHRQLDHRGRKSRKTKVYIFWFDVQGKIHCESWLWQRVIDAHYSWLLRSIAVVTLGQPTLNHRSSGRHTSGSWKPLVTAFSTNHLVWCIFQLRDILFNMHWTHSHQHYNSSLNKAYLTHMCYSM